MKTLHSMMVKSISTRSGIINQMNAELKASKTLQARHKVKVFYAHVENLNIEDLMESTYSDLVYFYKLNSNTRLGRFIEHRRAYYSWLEKNIEDVDCFILRFSIIDPFQLYFIKKSFKPVLLVHHTKELDEMNLNGFKGRLFRYIDMLFGNLAIKAASGIVGVTNEIIEYEKKRIKDSRKTSILYPNGISYSDDNDLEFIDRRKYDRPEVIFIASYFYDWHGLDLLIKELSKSDLDILIHIVGKVNSLDANEIKKDKRFKMHGNLDKKEIVDLSSRCWVSLGSLALYRKNMKEACTLKVRESLSMGLPVYSAHRDVFPESFPFYKCTDFSIQSLYDYSVSMRKIDKKTVRKLSEQYISKAIILEKFLKEIKSLIES